MAEAARLVGLRTYREFPKISAEMHREILLHPEAAVRKWWSSYGGKEDLECLMNKFDFIGDGWIPLLPFLDVEELVHFKEDMLTQKHILIRIIATVRDLDSIVRSELQNWAENDLERLAELDFSQRCDLERLLRVRAAMHRKRVDDLSQQRLVKCLELKNIESWPHDLIRIVSGPNLEDWEVAFAEAGQQNQSNMLPKEGVLLTFRLDEEPPYEKVGRLLRSLKEDRLSRFFVVLGLDSDELSSDSAARMRDMIEEICPVYQVENPPRGENKPFEICKVWDAMAVEAIRHEADWVVLLGDDIEIECPFHYRATYRSFIDISERLGCSIGFGCPWWNDRTFPGFPTFPVVGKAHFEIFGSLIPSSRGNNFVNQDLDPYLQRLYLKFGAAPLMEHAILQNQTGGNNTNLPRYEPVNALGWRDWVLEDVEPLRTYLSGQNTRTGEIECLLVDVVIPTFRINITYLQDICSITVPDRLRTSFIVVVDNPTKLKHMMKESDSSRAALALESQLVAHSKKATKHGNNIRVRCNNMNMGASATRNRGIDESAAEYILFLDDDVRPKSDLLAQYERVLLKKDPQAVGLVGMVQFPRSQQLSILHAGVLMSYLTFMFEIASNEKYKCPAWGVTANLLVKRLQVRFDTIYAKTGGGEDVDFCLRMTAESNGGRFESVQDAVVYHDFWPGGLRVLLPHFFHWAIGDGALFQRYPEHCYRSWPNIAEMFVIFSLVWLLLFPFHSVSFVAEMMELAVLFTVDSLVELSDLNEFHIRCRLLDPFTFSMFYYTLSHILASLYVAVLEFGRLCGHLLRWELIQNAMRRFDWHCNRLPTAPERYRRRERKKFVLFLLASAINWIYFSPDWGVKLVDSIRWNKPTSTDLLVSRDGDL